jgi:CMP-N-acetylneuraminate monooxygenase
MLPQNAVDLGPVTAFTEWPTRISLGSKSYYVVRGEAGWQLLSTICPHQGGEVVKVGPCLACPQHGWTFEQSTGKGINNTGALSSIPVTVWEGRLFAEIPLPAVSPSLRPPSTKRPEQLTLQLHAHACLEIVSKGFSLLTDPWLCGPAFLGAWTQYPPPVIDVSTLRPDAIVITHEHSDHFHEPTLRRFARSTPIYVPDFPNRRLVRRLAALGFTKVYPMAFGDTFRVADHVQLTCFEPGSWWNDAIVLMEIDGFRLLNLNDAGLNQRIASLVAPVDAIASQFSIGASGYPLTWNHLSDDDKHRIMDRARQGKLQMLKDAMALYKGEVLIPFASHFALWHPAHREYVRMMPANTVDDVLQAFAGSGVRVVDLLPGESWDASSGHIRRLWGRRAHLYDLSYKLRYLERCFDPRIFGAHHPAPDPPTRAEVERYLLGLNETPEVALCEDLTVRVRAMRENCATSALDVAFTLETGRLRILKDLPEETNLLIEIPCGVLKRIVTENLSWDEAHIGYWCRFTRSPDVYHAGFWRLLQAPYYCSRADAPRVDHEPITEETVIADLIETYGDQAARVMRRYGLYCVGCHHSPHDTVRLGARHHGLNARQIDALVRELNQMFRPNR